MAGFTRPRCRRPLALPHLAVSAIWNVASSAGVLVYGATPPVSKKPLTGAPFTAATTRRQHRNPFATQSVALAIGFAIAASVGTAHAAADARPHQAPMVIQDAALARLDSARQFGKLVIELH